MDQGTNGSRDSPDVGDTAIVIAYVNHEITPLLWSRTGRYLGRSHRGIVSIDKSCHSGMPKRRGREASGRSDL